MAGKRRRSYAWALLTEVANVNPWQLTPAARVGLELARELAHQHRRYKRAGGERDNIEPRLTVEELADSVGLSPSTVYRRIAAARWELFGLLTDRAIWLRAAKRKKRLSLTRAPTPAPSPASS